jgi:TetR/AcrR family transcriptional regulator
MNDAPSSRDKILDVAESLFARRGYSGVGLREVADRAGLGKSSLFHHFRSKTQLYSEVQTRVLERFRDRLESVLAEAHSPMRRLERAIEEMIDALAEQPTTARLLLRSLFEDDDFAGKDLPEFEHTDAVLAAIIGRVAAFLEEGIAQGEFRRVSVPDTVQSLIGSIVYHFASAEIGESILGGPLFSAEAVARRRREVVELFRNGLAARPQPV